MSSSSNAVDATVPVEVDNTQPGMAVELNDEEVMINLFTHEVQVEAPEEVVVDTVKKLAEFKVNKPWKLQKCPDAALLRFLPMDGHFEHYLVAVQVRDTLMEWERQKTVQSQQPSSQSDVALEAVRLMSKQLERQHKQQKTNKDSDTEDEEVKYYKCSKSLER